MGKARLLGCIIAVVSCASEGTVDELEVMRTELEVWSSAVDETTHAATRAETDDDSGEPDTAETDTTEPRIVARPNKCERFKVEIDARGRRHYKRIRKPWTRGDQKRFAKLVSLVSKEMGAEPKLIRAWALRESSYRPTAVHLLNPDIEAAMSAWRRHYYDAAEEKKLEDVLATASKRSDRYWKAKARLHRVRTFRDNPYLDERVEFTVEEPDGTITRGSEPAWAFGYGPFGFNPAYFVPAWDAKAPPWIFCDEDGLVAIVTAVWAARTAQRECDRLGFGGSYAVVNQRFGRGHCAAVGPTAKFRKRARRIGLDADARARLGDKWSRKNTDRAEVVAYMRARAREAELLPAPGS